MSKHNYENTLGTSYLASGGRYRDRVRYTNKHSLSRVTFNARLMLLGFLILSLSYHCASLEVTSLEKLNQIQSTLTTNVKSWISANVNAPKWVLSGGAYVILTMMAVTIFKG